MTRCTRLLVAMTVLWALASLSMVAAAVSHERARRYDGCQVLFIGRVLVHACPIGELRERPPLPPALPTAHGEA